MNIVNLTTLMQFRQPKILQLRKIHFKRNRTAATTLRLQIVQKVIVRLDTEAGRQPVLLINKCQNEKLAPEIYRQVKGTSNKRPHHHQTQQSVLVVQRRQRFGPNRILATATTQTTTLTPQSIITTHRNDHR